MKENPFVIGTSNGNLLLEVPEEYYKKLKFLGLLPDDGSHNVGASNYPEPFIQPWAVWLDWQLDPWTADIIMRLGHAKNGTPKSEDFRVIIHVCQEKLRQMEILEED